MRGHRGKTDEQSGRVEVLGRGRSGSVGAMVSIKTIRQFPSRQNSKIFALRSTWGRRFRRRNQSYVCEQLGSPSMSRQHNSSAIHTFIFRALLVLLFSGIALCPASADFYLFTYSDGAANTASGFLDTVDLGGGSLLAASGELNVTGTYAGTYTLIAGGPSTFNVPGFIVNNVLYPNSDPVLDVYGLAFVNGTTYLNIWGNSAGNYSFYTFDSASSSYGAQFTGTATATISAVPEPTGALLVSVLFVLASFAARKPRQA